MRTSLRASPALTVRVEPSLPTLVGTYSSTGKGEKATYSYASVVSQALFVTFEKFVFRQNPP